MEASLTVTEAARNLADLVYRAHHDGEATTLLENGRPVARIVPAAGAVKTGREIAAEMASGLRPRLDPNDAEAFEADLRQARSELREPVSRWD